MTKADEIFHELTRDEVAKNKPFSYFGWEGVDALAFYSMSDAYWYAAKVLLDKMKFNPKNVEVTDGLIYPLFFNYRHSVESCLKALFFKYGAQSEVDKKKYLEKGHSLYGLWKTLKPCLSGGVKHVGSSISLDAVEHYIREIHRFDPNSMVMRYPITKKLNPHPERQGPMHLDFIHFADCMEALCHALRQLNDDISGQIEKEATQVEVDELLGIYERYQDKIDKFLLLLTEDINCNPKETWYAVFPDDLEDLLTQSEPSYQSFLRDCEPDMLILLEALYYVGCSINQEVRLATLYAQRLKEFVQLCKEHLKANSLSFGNPIGTTYLKVQHCSPSALIQALSPSIAILKP